MRKEQILRWLERGVCYNNLPSSRSTLSILFSYMWIRPIVHFQPTLHLVLLLRCPCRISFNSMRLFSHHAELHFQKRSSIVVNDAYGCDYFLEYARRLHKMLRITKNDLVNLTWSANFWKDYVQPAHEWKNFSRWHGIHSLGIKIFNEALLSAFFK